MPFDILKNVPQQQRSRVAQQDLLTKAVKLRNSEIYSLGSETVIIYDMYGNETVRISQSDTAGKVYFGDDAYINYIDGTASFGNSVREYWLGPLYPEYIGSSNWTLLDTYQDVPQSLFSIDFDNFAGYNMYLETEGKTDAGTGYFQIYNVTDATALVGSECSTASTTTVLCTSGAITKPTGTKTLKVQYKIIGGNGINQYVNAILSKIIVRSA